MSRANGLTLVAEEDDSEGPRVVGSAIVLFRRGSAAAHLYSLAVAPESRGRGIGRALLAEIEEIARNRGLERVRLEVRTDNEAALGLYRSAGYAERGRRPEYYVDGCDAFVMSKELVSGPPRGGR